MIQKRNYRLLIDIVFVTFIFGICLWNLQILDRVKIIDDEFGYWGIAAKIVGYDWSDLMAATGYYSFGYSLLLVPLLFLNKIGVAMSMVYKLAIVENAILLVGTYFMIQYVAKKVFSDFPIILMQPVSLFITLYIGNSTRTNSAWTETCVLFVFWGIITLLISFLEKPGYINSFFLLLAAAYIFSVHMRAVGVVIALGIVMAMYILVHVKGVNKKQILFIVAWSVILVVFVSIIKNYVTTQIYFSKGSESVNDISGQVSRTKALLNVQGFVDIGMSILGKLYSVGASAFLLPIVGVIWTMCYLIKSVIVRIKDKTSTWQFKEWMLLFFILSFAGEVMVSAIFKCFRYYSGNVTTILADAIVYNRYLDFAVGPMILVSVYVIYHIAKWKGEIIAAVLFFLLCTMVVQYQFNLLSFYNEESSIGFRGTAAPWIALLYKNHIDYFAYYVAGVSIIPFLVICMTRIAMLKKPYTLGMVLVAISICWGIYSVYATDEFVMSKIKKEKTVCTVEEIIHASGDETSIYLLTEREKSAFVDVKILQWQLADKKINVCTLEKYPDIDKQGALFLTDTDNTNLNDIISNDMEYIYDSGTISVFVSKENEHYEEIYEKARQMAEIPDPTIDKIDLSAVTTDLSYIKPNGSLYYNYQRAEGYMTQGMGVVPEDGIYEFMIDMRVRECPIDGDIAYITIGNLEGQIRDTVILDANRFKEKERQIIKVQVQVKDGKEPLVGIYTYGNAAIRIYDISYKMIKNGVDTSLEDVPISEN